MNRRAAIADCAWLLCFGLASTVWCLSAAATLGPTFDEPIYIRCGLEHWQTGSYKQLMRLGTMPLAVDVQTLAVHLWERWRGGPLPLADALRCARAATLVFWWTLLIYTLRAGRMIGGRWGGRIAVALLAGEPGVLGHAALATSDIAVTAFLLLLAVEFYAGRESRWPRRVALPAILYGLAILAKASALVFGPLCLLTIVVERSWRAGTFLNNTATGRESMRRSLVDVAKIMIGGLVVTFLYCGSDWTTERTFIESAQTLPAGKFHDTMLWTSEHLRIFTNAGEGLAQQIKHNIRGHGSFILGREYRRAIWFYFPVALTIKTTLSLLAAPLVIVAVRRATLRNWACLIAGILLLYSMTCRVQIGVRFMLPLLVFLCVGLGAAAATALGQLQGWKRTALTVWLIVEISSAASAAIRVWPHGICFTNLAWGGTVNGYRLLSDSNYDWGQGLPELRKWTQQHGVEKMNVWYFGTDPSVHVASLRELPLHRVTNQAVAEAVKGKLVAVSTTLLYGTYTGELPSREAVAFFRSHWPISRTMTFLIYDFRESPRSFDTIEHPSE
jgi:hypothetical protein